MEKTGEQLQQYLTKVAVLALYSGPCAEAGTTKETGKSALKLIVVANDVTFLDSPQAWINERFAICKKLSHKTPKM